jgi:hypothetical protein
MEMCLQGSRNKAAPSGRRELTMSRACMIVATLEIAKTIHCSTNARRI